MSPKNLWRAFLGKIKTCFSGVWQERPVRDSASLDAKWRARIREEEEELAGIIFGNDVDVLIASSKIPSRFIYAGRKGEG